MGSTALVHWNDSKGRRYELKHKQFEGHRRECSGQITSLAQKIADHPAEWLYWYMLNILECSEGTVRSAFFGVSEQIWYTCKMAKRDYNTLTVTTDMAAVGGDNYVKEAGTAAMVDHREDIDSIDSGMVVVRNEVVDGDDEEE